MRRVVLMFVDVGVSSSVSLLQRSSANDRTSFDDPFVPVAVRSFWNQNLQPSALCLRLPGRFTEPEVFEV